MTVSNLTAKAARGVSWTMVQTIGSRLANLLVFIVLARLLAPNAFGLVALAAVVITVINAFIDQGLGAALVQRTALEREHIDTVFWMSLGMGLGLGLALLALADPIATLFNKPALAPVLRWLTLALPFAGLQSVPMALLQRRLEFRTMAQRALVASVLSGVAGIVAAAVGLGVWSLVIQMLLQAAVATVVLWLKAPWLPRLRVSRRHFRELFGFSSNIAVMNLLNVTNRRADDLLIGVVLGPVALGLYSVAYRILLVMNDVVIKTISTVAFPIFSRAQHDREVLRKGYFKATALCAAIAVPSFMLVAVAAPEITVVLFGPKWSASVPVMQALSFIGALQAVLFFNLSVLNAVGKSSSAMKLSALNTVSNVIAFSITVHWGILAVAIAYAGRGYLVAPVQVVIAKRLLDFGWREYAGHLVGPILATIVMALAALALRAQLTASLGPLAVLAVLLPFGAAVYAGMLRLTAPSLARDMRRFALAALPDFGRRGRRLAPTHEKASV